MVGTCLSLIGAVMALGASPTVLGVDGLIHQPFKEARGKPLALIFLSHDCPICNAYAPEIGRLQSAFGKKVEIDLVYAEPRLTSAAAKAHAREFSLGRSELLLDPKGELASYCKASVTPQAVVFDGSGRMMYSGRIDDRYISLGQQRPMPTTHDLRAALEAVLSHKKPRPAVGAPVGCFIVRPQNP